VLLAASGYFSLFLVGTQLGNMLLIDRRTRRDGWRLVMRLAVLDAVLWLLTLVADSYVEPNSRRMVRRRFPVLSVGLARAQCSD
jgi:hypothetical protein